MRNSYRIKYGICLLLMASLFASCNKEDSLDNELSSRTVNITFNASTNSGANPTSEETSDLRALVFRQTSDEKVQWLPQPETSWSRLSEDNYQMSCQLETGIYHFSLSKGLSVVETKEEGNSSNQCFWVENEESQSLNSYVVQHPKGEDGKLKECTVALFLNQDDMEKGKNIESNQEFSTALTHAQARLDFIIGYKGGDEVSPFDRIKEINIELTDINATYGLTGEEIQSGPKAGFSQTLVQENFEGFDIDSYKQEFKNSDNIPASLSGVTAETAKIKKWLFFPTESVNGTLSVTYNNDHTEVVSLNELKLSENMATIVVVWVSQEHLKLELEGIGEGGLGGSSGTGESGFWN